MKRYETVKVSVLATQMSREDYCLFRGWQLPADEHGADKGYLIDRSNGRRPDWTWVLADAFERGYQAV